MKLLCLLLVLAVPIYGQVASETNAAKGRSADVPVEGAKGNFAVPGDLTIGSIPSLPGFTQKGSTTVLDRDDQLRLSLNPEQFGAAGTGSGENVDDCAAINLAIQDAAQGAGLN